MRFPGHKNINNPLLHIQLEEAFFQHEDEASICNVASTLDEMTAMIEAGFEYVCTFNDATVFRKRK